MSRYYSPTGQCNSYLASFHNASNQLLSHLLSNRGVMITLIRTTMGLSLIYALLQKYWKNLSYPKFLPNSTHTIFTILVNQHIVLVTALNALLKVVSDRFLSLNKGNISALALLDFSSAFDTIDHSILVHRLHTDFGFTDGFLVI